MTREYLVTMDMAELTVRMIEAGLQCKRPPDQSIRDALAALPNDLEEEYHRAARAAADYFGERMQAALGAGNVHTLEEAQGHA